KAYGFLDVTLYSGESNEELQTDFYVFINETFVNTEAFNAMLKALKPRGKKIFKSRQHQSLALTVSQILQKEPIFYAVNYGSFEEALALMNSKQLDFSDIFGKEFDLEDFENVFFASKQSESCKLFFRF
ncbi:MAG: L-threonine 3-dehydrogenase, partial [Desertifilum sp. SIO1I2]|nr:L-threonine 3-dehydrogenase [Desertifilum sp. SIO1I2]